MDVDKRFKIGIISRLRSNLELGLKTLNYAVGAAVVIILAATVVMLALVWQSSANLSNRLAGMAAIFAGMTLLLTVFAVVVAYLAFSLSIGVPDLKLQVCFGTSRPNQLAVTAAESENGRLEATNPLETVVVIRFRNDGTFPAKAPAVIVLLDGMEFAADVSALNAAGWTVNDRSSKTGVIAVQWNGGAAYSVYSGLVFELPVLNLAGLRYVPDLTGRTGPVYQFSWFRGFRKHSATDEPPRPLIVVSILTDVLRKVERQPVDFIVNGESKFTPKEKNPEWL